MHRLGWLLIMGIGCEGTGLGDVDTATNDTNEAKPPDVTSPPIEPVDPLEGIGEVELVGDGFVFTEGPTWRPDDGVLMFTDIPSARIHRLTPPSTIDVFDANSNQANGLDTDISGELLVAEHLGRRVTRRNPDGSVADVIDNYEGNAFNSPNDLSVRSDGTLYFTDPPYGLQGRPREIDFNGLFRIPADGSAPVAEWQGDAALTRPNGLVLSPDESLLYLADTTGDISVFDVATDGSLTNRRTFTDDASRSDGMAIDAEGNLFVTADDGVRVYAPDGTLWGVIEVPLQPANCAFGDADAQTLYITARTALYRVRMARPGLY